jgi:hypothetical protein
MTNEILHTAIVALDKKVDELLERVHKIELGVARRSGAWGVVGRLATFAAGVVIAVVGSLII